MNTTLSTAAACFLENFQRFGSNPDSQQEQQNLYLGLKALVEGIGVIESQLTRMESKLQHIEDRIR